MECMIKAVSVEAEAHFLGDLGAALVTDFGWDRVNSPQYDDAGSGLSSYFVSGSYGYRVYHDAFKEKGRKWAMVKPESWR